MNHDSYHIPVMIISQDSGRPALIEQPEHARLCGLMARAWGAVGVAPPQPLEPVALAATEHDRGWREWESSPRYNPQSGRPYHYKDIPIEQHLTLYRRGIERAVQLDPYAGLLVSMHASKLYSRFRSGQPGSGAMLSEQRQLRSRLLEGLRTDPGYAPYVSDAIIETNSDLIFAWDTLSLFLCHGRVWIGEIEVPIDYARERRALKLSIVGPALRIDPFPFKDSLRMEIAALKIDRLEVEDQNALDQVIATGERISLAVRIEPIRYDS